jgi:hypothetical protein
MNLESLPNELLIDLFDYFSSDYLLHAFHDLNSRFNALLLDHFRTHGLDLRSISKHAFNTICRHLSFITNQITSLYLSEKDDTPGQMDAFYAHGFTLRRFVHLQSLSLYHFRSQNVMNKILLDLLYLSNISHLTFEECCFTSDEANASNFVTIIWNLPKLTYCYLKIQFQPQIYFPIPTVISSSIEYLSIYDIEPEFNQMIHLLEKTPHLQHISLDFHFNFSDEFQSSTITSIATLNVSFFSIEYHILANFFQNMPNLNRLKIDLPDMYIDGKTWEQIIETYLPKLESFQFRMNDELDSNQEQQIDEILNLFRTPFWLNKHQWFVRCDWNPNSDNLFFYSLPYAFENFYFQFPILSKSTCPDDDDQQWSYNSVRRLAYKVSSSEWSIASYHQFTKIEELCVYLPINDYFWSIVSKLERLKVLDVLSNENHEVQLQTLLNRASHVSVLRLRHWSSMVPEIKSHSLYQECIILNRLLFDIQCKILLIDVKNRTCILELVHTMNHLQALTIRCQDDPSIGDELFEWLRQNLPSSTMITRDYYPVCSIRLWIR